jgi:auxin influx carrier (AUX1 LAX family)
MMLGIHSCREVMHAMWRPQKFKAIYLLATLYVLTLTLPSAASVYWAFGDQLLTHSNALALLPRTAFRDAAVVLMLVHQFITFGFACTPLYFVWEKLIGLHDCRSLCKRAAARIPVVVPIWFLAIVFPFFGPINSAVGSLLVSFTVYIIPALAHMITFRSASAREVYYTLLLALFFTILLAVYLHAANNIICFLFHLACFL